MADARTDAGATGATTTTDAGTTGGTTTTDKDKLATLSDSYRGLLGKVLLGCGILIAAGVGTGIYMIVDNRSVPAALAVMAVPFGGVLALAVAAGSVVTFSVKGDTVDALKVRIVGILGGVLAILVIGAFALVLKSGTAAVPQALTAAISAIVGGLLGVLTPPSAASGQSPEGAKQTQDALQGGHGHDNPDHHHHDDDSGHQDATQGAEPRPGRGPRAGR